MGSIMSTPSPFNIAREISTNLSQSFGRVRDENAIEQILSKAMSSGDPEVMQNSIGQILSQVSPERQGTAIQYLQNTAQNIKARQDEARKRASYAKEGLNVDLDPKILQQQVKDRAKQGRLSQYGIGTPQSPQMQPMQGQGQQPMQGQMNQQQVQDPQKSIFENMTENQLIAATGAPDKEVSEPAKQTLETNRYKTKEVANSFKENNEYINKAYDQYEDSLRKEAIVGKMDQLNDSKELSDSGVINFLRTLGLEEEWLKNPANEEYSKLSLDILGGGSLQADYGSRVLASEFAVSQKRIPTLSQTKEGRKQISENIKTMLLPSKLKYERLQYYLDKAERTEEPLPHNLRGKILQDIKPQLQEAYDKFKQRNGRYKVSAGTPLDDNAIEKYYFISDGIEDKARKMMIEDGYDVK